MRPVPRFQAEHLGPDRRQAARKNRPRSPPAQLPAKLRPRVRRRIAPPRQPAEYARLPLGKGAALAPPVRHRARADAILRRQLPVGLFGRPMPPRAEIVATQIHVRQDAVLLVGNRRRPPGEGEDRMQHRFDGGCPRRRVKAAASHAQHRSTMLNGIKQISATRRSTSCGEKTRCAVKLALPHGAGVVGFGLLT